MSASEPTPDALSAYLDGELSDDERAAVEARLAASPEWRDELDQVRAARALVRGLPLLDPPLGLLDVGAPADELVARRRRRVRGRRVALVGAVAAAAALVAGIVAVPHSDVPAVRPEVATLTDAHAVRSSTVDEPLARLAPVSMTRLR